MNVGNAPRNSLVLFYRRIISEKSIPPNNIERQRHELPAITIKSIPNSENDLREQYYCFFRYEYLDRITRKNVHDA